MIPRVKGFDPDMPYNTEISRLPIFALFDLKGPSSALEDWCDNLPKFPVTPNSMIRDGELELSYIGPERYLLKAPIDLEESISDSLRASEAPPEISIVRVSDTQTFFRITGPDADQVVSIGCPLDIHKSAFGANAVSNTEFFGIKAMILRCTDGFEVAVEQSFGDMIADYLARSTA